MGLIFWLQNIILKLFFSAFIFHSNNFLHLTLHNNRKQKEGNLHPSKQRTHQILDIFARAASIHCRLRNILRTKYHFQSDPDTRVPFNCLYEERMCMKFRRKEGERWRRGKQKICFEMSEEVASMASGNAEEVNASERKVHHIVMRSRVCRRLNVRYTEEENMPYRHYYL